MTKQQRLIIAVLGAVAIIILCAFIITVFNYITQPASPPPSAATAAAAADSPTFTPEPADTATSTATATATGTATPSPTNTRVVMDTVTPTATPISTNTPTRDPNAGLVLTGANLVIEETNQAYPLEQNPALIGQDPGYDVTLTEDSSVSQTHAAISFDNRTFVLQDMGSENGTYLNGKLLTGPETLKDGDVIGVGNSTLVIQFVYGSAEGTPTPTG
jgi:pSer/pThr/pTyr-binding forkhead associated (FHA) protein